MPEVPRNRMGIGRSGGGACIVYKWCQCMDVSRNAQYLDPFVDQKKHELSERIREYVSPSSSSPPSKSGSGLMGAMSPIRKSVPVGLQSVRSV